MKEILRPYYYHFRQLRFPYRSYLDKNKAIFIHVPKAAGTSVLDAMGKKGQGNRDHLPWYVYHKANPIKFEQYFKFAFVRNPADRLYSAYNFLLKGWERKRSESGMAAFVAQFKCHNDFVVNGLPGSWLLGEPLFLPQSYFLLNEHGSVMVDFLGRFESIDKDFATVAQRLGLNPNLPALNRSGSERPDWSEDAKQVIRFLYGYDMETFGYSW